MTAEHLRLAANHTHSVACEQWDTSLSEDCSEGLRLGKLSPPFQFGTIFYSLLKAYDVEGLLLIHFTPTLRRITKHLNERIMSNATHNQTKTQKILIIEDEGDMCLLLNIMLDGKGMEVDHVKTLAGAEDYLQNQQPQVVILDNRLPDGFGIDFIPYLKKNYPTMKIIAISGVDTAARDVALENGANVFLEKPFTRGQLFEAITGLLNESEPVL